MYPRTLLFILFCATLQSIRVPMLWGVDFVLPALLCAGAAMNRRHLFVCCCIVTGGMGWMRGSIDPSALAYLIVPLLVHRNTVTYALLRDYYLVLCVFASMVTVPLMMALHGQDSGIATMAGFKNAAACFVLMTIYLFVILPRPPLYANSRGYTGSIV